jgi:hypothetical protein
MKSSIYYLHSGDFIPRYVGLTTKDISVRLSQHLVDRRHNPHKVNWIKKHKRNIEFVLIEEGFFSIDELKNKEIYWIDRLKSLGYNLLNATEGGDFSPNKGVVAKNKGVTKYGKEVIEAMLKDCVPGEFGAIRLSKKYNIPSSTVERYIKNNNK